MYGPDISFSTPILMVGVPCARARASGSAAAALAAPRRVRRDILMADGPSEDQLLPTISWPLETGRDLRASEDSTIGVRFRGLGGIYASYPKILVQLVHTRFELMVRDHVDHLAMLHDVVSVGHRLGEAEVLFHEQHREPALLDLAHGAADLLHDHRRQSFGRLVQEQQLGAGAQDARDRQHLLFA